MPIVKSEESADDKYEQIFTTGSDGDCCCFYQYLQKGDKFYMNIDGEDIEGPFEDHLECLKFMTDLVSKKESEHSERYSEISKLVDSW